MAVLRKQNPQAAESLAYKHPRIEAQLDAGVRQLELDVFGDAKGGLFADPLFLRLAAKEGPADPMPSGWVEAMKKPGFKVLHANDVDFRSHCWTLVACLQDVRTWSKAHPGHLPIYIQLENKDGRSAAGVRAAGNPDQGDDGRASTPRSARFSRLARWSRRTTYAASTRPWKRPCCRTAGRKLDWARGKVVFLLDQERVTPLYTEGHPSLRGRMMFTNGKPGSPDAAFVKINNAASSEIPELVRKGYLVRTMTDGGAQAVRAGDTKRRDQGIASGAQILSTDYPFDWKAEGSGYSVTLAAEKVRCNPVNAPKSCVVKSPY